MRAFLSLLSVVYRTIIFLRAFLYRIGLLRQFGLPLRVISVGNITVGGTGKTPAVIAIAALLQSRGKRPVILSRGYGRADETAVQVVPRSSGEAAAYGDEPALMADVLPGVPVIVGKDRYRSGMLAVDRFAPAAAVLDDGFQHLRLRRDLDIVLIDATDPFGNGYLLPAGILREPVAALSRADVVVLTHADQARDLDAVRGEVGRFTTAPILAAKHAPTGLVAVATGETMPVSELRNAAVFAFCGIARPEAFFGQLGSLGASLTGTAVFPDHHPYQHEELDNLRSRAADSRASMLVTTDKDAIKLRELGASGVWALRITMDIAEKEIWEEMLLRGL